MPVEEASKSLAPVDENTVWFRAVKLPFNEAERTCTLGRLGFHTVTLSAVNRIADAITTVANTAPTAREDTEEIRKASFSRVYSLPDLRRVVATRGSDILTR